MPQLPPARRLWGRYTDLTSALNVRWFLRDASRDPRFLLRKGLQLRKVTSRFDIILLDCPPLLNISCVNALAASDHVLVPVLPSRQATDRVAILFDRLKELQENLNSDLRLLGFFGNRTNGSSLSSDEENKLSLLSAKCKTALDKSDGRLQSFIRRSTEIRAAEDEHRPLKADDDMRQAFVQLAREIEQRLPTFCRPKTTLAVAAGEVMA